MNAHIVENKCDNMDLTVHPAEFMLEPVENAVSGSSMAGSSKADELHLPNPPGFKPAPPTETWERRPQADPNSKLRGCWYASAAAEVGM